MGREKSTVTKKLTIRMQAKNCMLEKHTWGELMVRVVCSVTMVKRFMRVSGRMVHSMGGAVHLIKMGLGNLVGCGLKDKDMTEACLRVTVNLFD